MSERMIIDALPGRNNILLRITKTNTGNAVVDAMIQCAFRACIEELDNAPKIEVPEWRRAGEIPVGRNDEWNWVFIVGKDAKKAYTTTAAAQYDAKEDCWVTDLLTEFKKVDGHYLTKDLGYEVTHWMPQPEPPERGKNA